MSRPTSEPSTTNYNIITKNNAPELVDFKKLSLKYQRITLIYYEVNNVQYNNAHIFASETEELEVQISSASIIGL